MELVYLARAVPPLIECILNEREKCKEKKDEAMCVIRKIPYCVLFSIANTLPFAMDLSNEDLFQKL